MPNFHLVRTFDFLAGIGLPCFWKEGASGFIEGIEIKAGCL